MKSTALFFVFLCFSLACSISLRSQSKSLATSQIENLIKQIEDDETGDLILDLAQLYLSLEGPIDQLKEEIGKLVNDLDVKLKNENDAFTLATNNHNNRVTQLKSEISSAERNIAESTQKLQNVLYPRKADLERQIKTLQTNIHQNRQNQQQETNQRNKDHAEYVQKQKDIDVALAALDEAINIVKTLKNPHAALIEVRRAKNALQKIQSRMTGNLELYSPLISALISLSQNFSDQSAVQKVLDLLNKIRSNVVQADNEEDATEAAQLKAYNERMTSLKKELVELSNTLSLRQADLTKTIKEITSEEAYLAQRKSDLAKYKKTLAEEEENYKKVTNSHNDIVTTLHNEQDTVQKAIKLLQSISVRDYLTKRVNA